MFSRRCLLLKGSFSQCIFICFCQQDVISVATETAESNTSDLPSSEGGVRTLWGE